jgi:CRP-like cAMP-binding protein
MQEHSSFRSHHQVCLPLRDRRRALITQDLPRRNRLLAALPQGDCERLLPHLEPIALPAGWTVHGAGDREKYLYFITAGIVARYYTMENGASAACAVTGREGVIGVASFLGGGSTMNQSLVLVEGRAYRLGVGQLKDEFERDRPLAHLLLRFTLALMAQIGQNAACGRHHALEQRLCSWILACVDRLPENDLAITQELIADALGVRREGVTQAVGKLQKAGLIHCSRGRLIVADRQGLEAHACECYAVVKRAYQQSEPESRLAALAA